MARGPWPPNPEGRWTPPTSIKAIRRVLVLSRDGAADVPASKSCPVCNIDLSRNDTTALHDELATLDAKAVLLIHAGITVQAVAFAQMLPALTMADIDGLQSAGEVTRGTSRRIIPPLGGDPVFTRWEGATFTGGLLVRGEAVARALRQVLSNCDGDVLVFLPGQDEIRRAATACQEVLSRHPMGATTSTRRNKAQPARVELAR